MIHLQFYPFSEEDVKGRKETFSFKKFHYCTEKTFTKNRVHSVIIHNFLLT
jgi:hypothetical protein